MPGATRLRDARRMTLAGAFILLLAVLGNVAACSGHAAGGTADAGADSQCAALGEVSCDEAPWLHCTGGAHGYQCNFPGSGLAELDSEAECEGGAPDPACGGYAYDYCCTFGSLVSSTRRSCECGDASATR